MAKVVPIPRRNASKSSDKTTDTSVGKTNKSTDNATDTNVSEDTDWFTEMLQSLLGSGAGTTLHYISGFDERSCWRYASGSVKVKPADLLRAILRSDQGGPFLGYIMEGSTAPWWRDHLEAAGKAALLDRIKSDLNNKT